MNNSFVGKPINYHRRHRNLQRSSPQFRPPPSNRNLPNEALLPAGSSSTRLSIKKHKPANMAQGYAVFIGLVVIAALCVASWFLAPKGENQVLWRSSLILAIVSCYLMWAITFMAQLHPLIAPRRTGIREEYLD
ncbi:hypothetical protein CDV36_006587 [Fusarium kuroshium]|uniref:V-type proton ATPase subunit e n=2 Tax=Fusarium solani species complex TaxID=232080 RepID=A0A3M2S834_9HYPO|nr:hypothetical protein CDV36_006587 [Fusarium kuroshium]RSL75956.1 hypothetical protein CEP51_010392 [Fusarium floridanum]